MMSHVTSRGCVRLGAQSWLTNPHQPNDQKTLEMSGHPELTEHGLQSVFGLSKNVAYLRRCSRTVIKVLWLGLIASGSYKLV